MREGGEERESVCVCVCVCVREREREREVPEEVESDLLVDRRVIGPHYLPADPAGRGARSFELPSEDRCQADMPHVRQSRPWLSEKSS